MIKKRQLVLVVDDEPLLRKVLKRLLGSENYEVITACDGESAIQLAKEKTPDIILLDIIMPGMDGREVYRMIRKLSIRTKTIYFTGKAEPLEPEKLKELKCEADGFIAKPATREQILSTLDSLLL